MVTTSISRKLTSNVFFTVGDIFARGDQLITADALVSPANSFGFMDGGIDLVSLRASSMFN